MELLARSIVLLTTKIITIATACYLYYMHGNEMEKWFVNTVADFLPVIKKETDPVIILFWFSFIIFTLILSTNLSTIVGLIYDFFFIRYKKNKFKLQFSKLNPKELRALADLPFWVAYEKNAIHELRIQTEINLAKEEYL